MYASRFSKRKAAPKKRFARRPVRKSRGPRKSIAQVVKSIISRQAENKAWFNYGANQTITTVTSGTPFYKNLVPILSQGTGKSDRVGNECRVKSGYIRGHVNLLPYDSVNNSQPAPIWVKIWILSSKTINSNNLPATTNIFDIVNGSVSFQGTMLDQSFTLNNDAWVSHGVKQFKLGASYTSSLSPVSTGSYFDNSPMSVGFYFNFGKYLKGLKYDDNSSVATNRNMFIVIQCSPANGQNGGGLQTAEMHYTTRVEYEDM